MTDFTNIPAAIPPNSPSPAPSNARPIGDYFNLAWQDFLRQPVLLMAFILAPIMIQFVVAIPLNILIAVVNAQGGEHHDPIVAIISVLVGISVGLVLWVLQMYIGTTMRRTILMVAAGKNPTFSEALSYTPSLLQAILAFLLCGIIVASGMICLIIPGMVLAVLTSFTVSFVFGQNINAIDAIRASINLVKNNVGEVLIMFLCMLALMFAGLLACGVGVLVAAPVASLMFAHLFLDLSGTKIP
jgi:hypothetical protein